MSILKFCTYSKNQHDIPLGLSALNGLLLAFLAIFNISCLGGDGSSEVESSSFGLRIVTVSGDNQVLPPDQLFEDPAIVKVIDSSGQGVEGISVSFSQSSGASVFITNNNVQSNSAGLAQTSVRSPVEFNQTGKIKACINSSSTCTEFTFSSNDSSDTIKYQLVTENNGTETAGEAFTVQIRTVDAASEELIEYNGIATLEWTFVSADSWAGVAPTLMPPSTTCVFVDGICNPSDLITLTDAREKTRVFFGDGEDGFIDVFGQQITVVAGTASAVTITDAPGGPDLGANTIGDTVFNADDPDMTFYAALTDDVGNYISDATSVTWSGSHPTQIVSNLSTLAGATTTLDFNQSIPFPSFGFLNATVPGFPTSSSGKISIDPGTPVSAEVRPVDANYTRVGGESFDFEIHVLDANGNLFGQQFGSTGYTGTFPVTFTFSNYHTGPIPSGGVIPMIHQSGANSQTVATRTLNIPFFGGKAQFLPYSITFFDATSVNPEVATVVDASSDTELPDVSGQVTYNMVVGPPDHLMLRDALGATADSSCPADYTSGSSNSWRVLREILQFDYLSTVKTVCTNLILSSGDTPVNIYASVEDKGGNFIDNLSVDWITTDIVNPDSYFASQLSGASPSNTQLLTPNIATNNDPEVEWVRVQGTYSAVAYDQYFRMRVRPGVIDSIELRIVRPQGLTGNEAIANQTHTLAVIPKDSQGNEVSGSFTRNLNVTVGGAFNSAPDGQTSSFFTSGAYNNTPFSQMLPVDDTDNIKDNTAVATFTGLVTPNAGDVVTITVTDIDDPTISATLNWTVIPGDVDRTEIWRDDFPPGGTEITNQSFTMSADQSTDFYAVAKDEYGNPITVNSSWVTWNDAPQPFAPADAISGLTSSTVQTPFDVDKPGTGRIQLIVDQGASGGSATASTGLITLVPGAPNNLRVDMNSGNSFLAGDPQDVTISIRDAKNNIVTSINGSTGLAINVSNNSLTRLNYDETAPPSGNYNFTNGEYLFTGAEAFTLFNSTETPKIQVSTTTGPAVVGQSPLLSVGANTFDHLALISANTQIDAGTVNRYTVRAEDLYGNKLTVGADATKNVTFTISSSLGDEDIVGSDLTGSSIANYALPGQVVVSGGLTNGDAFVDVTSTAAGTLTVTGNTAGIVGTNTENALVILPLSTISGIRYKASESPTSPSTTINPLLPFKVELLDTYGNVSTTNSTDEVELLLLGASQGFGNYSDVTVSNGVAVFSGLRYTLADSFTIRARLKSNTSLFTDAAMVVENGSVTRTVVVLPDQTFTEGTGSLASAVTGVPFSGTATRTAGDTFNIDVHAVDGAYNTIGTYTGSVSLDSTDPYLEVTPGTQNFVSGIATFNVRVRQQGPSQTISADSGFINNASTSFSVVPNSATQLVTLLPGQILREGAPNLNVAINQSAPDQTAGTNFNVEVRAVDAYFNFVNTYTHANIAVSFSADPQAVPPASESMSAGTASFVVKNFLAASGHTIVPATGAAPALTGQPSEAYDVNANTATQYIAVLPGQTYNSGQAVGDYAAAVTGTPSDQDTDSSFSVNLYAVDTHFNTRLNYNGAVSIATPNDPRDVEPAASNFTAGVKTFNITPVTAAPNQNLNITSALSSNTPATYDVEPGSPTHLIAVFTDYQTLVEGNTNLSTAVANQTVQNRVSGTATNVRVYSTDSKFNIVDDDSTVVSLTPPVSNVQITPASQSLTNGQADFSVATYLVGSGYSLLPTGGAYTQNPSTDYNVVLGSGKKLLVVLPNQTFSPGQASAAAAASGTPFNQTQGAGFQFQARVYSTDDYYNPRTTDTDVVTITPSLASVVAGGTSLAMTAGQADFTLHHTASGNGQSIQASAGGFTSNTSKTYDVVANLSNPTLALDDPTTSDTDYIRQNTVGTTIGADGTATHWCVSESQSTIPSSGTNSRETCVGGAGASDGWFTARPSTFTTSAGQGLKTIYLWTSDSAFNVSPSAISDTITLDSIKPNDPVGLSLADQSSMSTSYTNAAAVNLNVTLSGDTVDWCIIEQALIAAPPATPAYNDGCWTSIPGIFPYTHNLATTGSRSVYVFAKDTALNISANYASASIVYDNASPVFPGGPDIIGALGGTDTLADEWLGSTTTPTVQWQAATDDTTVTYSVSIKSGGSDICGSPISTTSTSHTFPDCLTHGNTYTIHVTATDSAEEFTVADNDGFSFEVDTVFPSPFTVNGLDGGTDSTVDAYLTDAIENPRLNWNDTTGEDGYSVFIVNDAETVTECGVDVAAADATSYQSFTGCTLNDNTDYKIRVIAFDDAGNQTEATNSPFSFETTESIRSFLVELVPGSNPTAGNGFSIRLTAKNANNETVSAYSGVKTINWTSNGSTGTDVCSTASNMNPEYAVAALNFTGGVAITGSDFKLKVVESSRTITATEQDTGNSATGTSSNFDVTASTLSCVRIEDQAGGVGSPLGPETIAIDTLVDAYAAGYDIFGNYLADQSVTWSGTGVLANKAFPITGASTQFVATEAGSGQLVASGITVDGANFNVNTGVSTLTSSTSDVNGNNHLANNNSNAVFHWDVENDAVTAWMTNSGLSWHSEGTSATRGAQDDFPNQVFIVASNSGLDIIDESSNTLFMRFNAGSDFALDNDLGNVVDITALNGKVILTMNDGASTGGIIIIDFENDEVYQFNSSARLLSANDLSSRNSSATWNVDTTYPNLNSSRLNKIVSQRVGGNDYLFAAHDSGIDVLRISGAITIYGDSTANPVFAVDVDSTGTLYYSEDDVGVHRADLSLPIGSNFSPTRTYDLSSSAELSNLLINDISVAEGTSSADAGKNTLLVASALGLTSIQEHGTFSSSTSHAYTSMGSGENPFAGAVSFIGNDGYISLADGANLTGSATFELWFRPASSVSNKILLQKGSGVDGAVELAFNGTSNLVFQIRHNGVDYAVTSTNSTWNNNQWYYVAATISPTEIVMWIDGVDKQSNSSTDFTLPAPFDISPSDLYIGGNTTTGYFDGLIDEIRVSDTVRFTSATITVPTAEFIDDANTEHLLHFDNTSGATASYSDGGAQVNGLLNGACYFTTPLYNSNSESIENIDSFVSAGRISTQFVNTNGWFELLDLQGATPYESDKATGVSSKDIKIYHKDSVTDNDAVIGLSSGGIQLRRR